MKVSLAKTNYYQKQKIKYTFKTRKQEFMKCLSCFKNLRIIYQKYTSKVRGQQNEVKMGVVGDLKGSSAVGELWGLPIPSNYATKRIPYSYIETLIFFLV